MTPNDQQLAPAQLIPAALAAGALSPADVVDHGVLVEQVGRSHAVYRVSVGGKPRFYVKIFGASRGTTDGLAEREFALQALAVERPAVAALVPAPWPWAPLENVPGGTVRKVVATMAINGAEAWSLEDPIGAASAVGHAWAELVQALAAPLAAFHRATRDLARPDAVVPAALQASLPWGLCLMDGDAAPELWAGPVTGMLLREAADDGVLIARLRAVRALWRPIALIHADLKHDNVLIERAPERVGVRVLDWEMARVGDPAWDLAVLAARLAAVRQNGPPWPDADLNALALLVRAYAAASTLRAPALAKRLVGYAGAALLMMALQYGSTLPPGVDLDGARGLLLKARSTFRRADSLTAAVIARTETAAA